MSFTSQRQWFGATSTGWKGLKLCPDWEYAAARRKVDFERLIDHGDALLNLPDGFVQVGLQQFLRLADHRRSHIDGWRNSNPRFRGREHDGDRGIAHFREVRVLRHVLLFVGGNGPGAKVVDLLVHVVADGATFFAPLRLEDAQGFAMALDRSSAGIYGFDILLVKNDGRSVLGVVRRVRFVGFDSPIGHRLIFAEDAGRARSRGKGEQHSHQDGLKTHDGSEPHFHHQFPLATCECVSTSCC